MENGSNATTWQKWLRDVHVNHPRSRRGGAFFYSNSQVVRGADKKASVLLGEKGMIASARAKAEAKAASNKKPAKDQISAPEPKPKVEKPKPQKKKEQNHHLILMLHSPHLVPQIQVQTINQNHRLLQAKKLKKWMLK